MIPILYEKDETEFTSNGLGRLRDCISCIVTEERNGIYECDFEYPVNGSNYDLIQAGRIIAVTHDEADDIQPFDIVSYNRPINGIVTFHCTHISYRQSKMTVSGTEINSLADALDLLLTATPANPFNYSTDMTSSSYFPAADGIPHSVRQMLGGMEGSILDTYGGEYEWDKWSVRLLSSRGVTRDFTIRYGVNLTGYNEDIDYSGTYTSCIPFWKGDVSGTETVVIGSKVTTSAIPYDGREACLPLDLSERFESEPTTQELEDAAASLMVSRHVYSPAQTIDVNFIRLQDSPEYANYANLLNCKLCDSIMVIFPMYNMTGNFKIVKTVYDVLADRFNSMELGTLSMTLSEALGVNGSGGSGGGGGGGTDTTYVLSINGDTITLTGSDGSSYSVVVPDTNTTYTISNSGQTITLTPSNGAAQSITLNGITDVKVNGTSVVTAGVANISNATTTASGAMSATDKTKLDGIASGAEVNVLEGVQLNGTDLTITSKKVNIPVMTGATTSSAGKVGLVPAPSSMTSGQYKVLLDDGAWHKVTSQNLNGGTSWYGIINIDEDNYIQFSIPLASSSTAGLVTASERLKITNLYENIYPSGAIFETTDSAYDPNTTFGYYWAMLGQLMDSDSVYLETSDGEFLYADEPSIVRTYKWVRIWLPK